MALLLVEFGVKKFPAWKRKKKFPACKIQQKYLHRDLEVYN